MPELTAIEKLQAELAAVKAENAQLKATATAKLYLRISEKKLNDDGTVKSKGGGVSLYGLGRWPVTLYYEQWIAVLDFGPKIREFIRVSKAAGLLKTKAEAQDNS